MMKMMIKRLYIAIALVALNIMPMQAQTHAEATSQKWKGVKVDTILNNAKYPDVTGKPKGFPILLYNVGTGRFVIQGGDWAMEGRLFYSDFGRTMYLCRNGRINSGITETSNSSTKNSFCVRPPEPFGKKWSEWNSYNMTTLMDGATSPLSNQKWNFERVEDADNTDTNTYYMYQKNGDQIYYLGAAYGEWWGDSVKNPETGRMEGKPKGQLSFLDDDRCTWTTAPVKEVTDKYRLSNGDEVELQKLYQWKVISQDEFIAVLNDESEGLNPSISARIPDRDFTRNSIDFFADSEPDYYQQWTVAPLSGYHYGGDGTTEGEDKRYTYTWADWKPQESDQYKSNQQYSNGATIVNRIVDEPWDSPVKLKAVFDKYYKTSISQNLYRNNNMYFGMKNAKYGFLPFEGVGTITTNFKVPNPGWYELVCTGFISSEQDAHDAYFFARVIKEANVGTPENEIPAPEDQSEYGDVTLKKVPFGTYEKGHTIGVRDAGKELLTNGDSYKQKVWVLVSQEDFDEGKNTIRVGIRKEAATKSSTATNGGYYDTDWVCVDDIRALYMGKGPAFFYEDMETLNYLDDVNHNELYLQHEYAKGGVAGQYGGAVCLQRTFTVGEWNTFTFPLPMTGEQVRYAFSQDAEHECELLEMNQTIKSGHVIDFKTVDLMTTKKVLDPGKFYLLKATKHPSIGENPRGKMANYYDLGKMFFSINASDENNSEYDHPYIDLRVVNKHTDFAAPDNPGTEWVSYVQTPSYSKFRVDSSGNVILQSKNGYDLGIVNNTYAPKGSYVMSGGKMYELKRDTPLKGFRGWITLTHSIFDDTTQAAQGAKFAINGVIDGEDPIATSIDRNLAQPVNVRAIAGVYDLMGRKVGDTIENLPKGLYIVSGKKLLVK